MTANEKRRRFREIVAAPGLTLLPGAHDALSARLVEAAGFEAIVAGGYAALGTMMAAPDQGQSNLRDMTDHYARICDAVSVPVFVDADTGFGGVHNATQTVRMLEKAGVSGLFIGDQVFPNRCGYLPGKEVIGTEAMLAKLFAALDARTDEDLFIGARSDVFALEGLDAAIHRCRLFAEAGADLALPQGVDTPERIARALREIPGPHFANQSHAAGPPKVALSELETLGVAAVTFPSALLFAAAGAVRRTLDALRQDRSFDAVSDELLSLDEYYDAVDLHGMLAREQSWDDRAAALVKTADGKDPKTP